MNICNFFKIRPNRLKIVQSVDLDIIFKMAKFHELNPKGLNASFRKFSRGSFKKKFCQSSL